MTWQPMNADGTRWQLMAISYGGFRVRAGIVERAANPWSVNYRWQSDHGRGCMFYSLTLWDAGELVWRSALAKGYT